MYMLYFLNTVKKYKGGGGTLYFKSKNIFKDFNCSQ